MILIKICTFAMKRDFDIQQPIPNTLFRFFWPIGLPIRLVKLTIGSDDDLLYTAVNEDVIG